MTDLNNLVENVEPMNLESCTQVLDSADIYYLTNKTLDIATTRLLIYTNMTSLLPNSDKIIPFTRLTNLFIDDWNTQQILLDNKNLRNSFKNKFDELEHRYSGSSLEGVSELLDRMQIVKNIILAVDCETSETGETGEINSEVSGWEEPDLSSDEYEIYLSDLDT